MTITSELPSHRRDKTEMEVGAISVCGKNLDV